jgi:hypothetical protein
MALHTRSPPLSTLKAEQWSGHQFWLPLPLNQDTLFQRTLWGTAWSPATLTALQCVACLMATLEVLALPNGLTCE